MTEWAEDHAHRYGPISVLPFDPSRHPSQRLEEVLTRADVPTSSEGYELRLRAEYERILGADALQASDRVLVDIGSQIKAQLSSGKSIAVLAAHGDSLHDIGTIAGGIALALADPSLVARNATMLNKVMSREAFDGTPIPRLIGPFASVYWVIPQTASAASRNLPPDLVRRLNSAALRTLIADLRTGIVLTWAPGGSAMRIQRDASGAVTALTIPEAPSAAGKLLSRFDSYVVSSVWESGIAIGPLRSVAPSTDPDQLMRTAMIEMATRTQSLAGCPTRYEISS